MKVANIAEKHPMTKTSYFLIILVKLCFLTIKKDDQVIRLSYFKLILYLAASYGWFVLAYILSNEIGLSDLLTKNNEAVNKIKSSDSDTYKLKAKNSVELNTNAIKSLVFLVAFHCYYLEPNWNDGYWHRRDINAYFIEV